jgi:uncharacterized membrane protein
MTLRRAIPIGLLLALVVAVPASAQRRYAVDSIVVDAAVREDGAMDVRESISYAYRGAYTFAFRDIRRLPGETVDGIAVAEGGEAYARSDSSEAPGTFVVAERGDSTRVTWYYRAEDERRTFDLSYVVHGAVRRHPDTAELYYQFMLGAT